MMSVSPDSWAYRQQTRYRFWRWLMRDFLLHRIGFRVLVKPIVQGMAHVPATGPTILMMNHTIAIDGVLPMGLIRQRDVIPMVKMENMQHPFIGPLARRWGAYGVERGEVDREALKTTLELLALNQVVLIAPEGTRQAQLIRPKDGLAYIALKSGAAIVPTAIWNGETWVKDLLRPRRTYIHVHFGRPFRLKGAGQRIPREGLHAFTDQMMAQLAALLPPSYRGEYADLSQPAADLLDFLP
jgi:1-acyl-sn-glycerol-3-phosphate acyltransferase